MIFFFFASGGIVEPALRYAVILGIDQGLESGFLSENMSDQNGMVVLNNGDASDQEYVADNPGTL
jgi:hypothetical protein